MTEGQILFWASTIFALVLIVIPSLVLDYFGWYARGCG